MKKSNKLFALLSAVFLLSLFLVACGGDNDPTDTGSEPATTETGTEPGDTDGTDEPAETGVVPEHIAAMLNDTMPYEDVEPGGVLRFARVVPTPFAGNLNSIFSMSADDSNIQEFFGGALFSADSEFLMELGDDARGAAIPEISEDGLSITFTIRDGVYWHDGEPVTAHDIAFTYHVVANPEYFEAGHQRFTANERAIVGATDYHEGNADSIAGIEVLADNVVRFTYYEVMPLRSIYFYRPIPKHIFGEMEISEMGDSIYNRTEAAIGFGPFIIDTIVPGESVTFTRNDNYWQGPPLLDGVEFRVVNPDLIGHEFQTGTVDIAHTFAEASFPYFDHLDNVTYLKAVSFVYNYLGFRLGSWDADNSQSVINPDATMASHELRLAMWKAIDNGPVVENVFQGLRWEGASLIPPAFDSFHNPTVARPPYDVVAANALLDEAGFVIPEGEDYRHNPDGTPLEINFVANADPLMEPIFHYYVAQWRNELSLNVVHDFTREFNDYNALFQPDVDYDGVDVFVGAWSTGTNPSPAGIHGRYSPSNRSRYVSERHDELIARIDGPVSAVDMEYRAQAFADWQEYQATEALQLIPTMYRLAFIPVNNRVVNYRINATHTPTDGWHRVGLTNPDAPHVHGQ